MRTGASGQTIGVSTSVRELDRGDLPDRRTGAVTAPAGTCGGSRERLGAGGAMVEKDPGLSVCRLLGETLAEEIRPVPLRDSDSDLLDVEQRLPGVDMDADLAAWKAAS